MDEATMAWRAIQFWPVIIQFDGKVRETRFMASKKSKTQASITRRKRSTAAPFKKLTPYEATVLSYLARHKDISSQERGRINEKLGGVALDIARALPTFSLKDATIQTHPANALKTYAPFKGLKTGKMQLASLKAEKYQVVGIRDSPLLQAARGLQLWADENTKLTGKNKLMNVMTHGKSK